ncbi:MAG: CbiX/SirB N-terminal domain-containing protein [Burkholderiaceae bacterium]
MSAAKPAILLLAHGARDPRWAAPFEAMAARIATLAPDLAVRLSYLDFIEPSLADAGKQLVQEGCDRIDIVPLFLGSGGHVRNDVPRLVAELRTHDLSVTWTLHPAIGELNEVIEAMANAALRLTRRNG